MAQLNKAKGIRTWRKISKRAKQLWLFSFNDTRVCIRWRVAGRCAWEFSVQMCCWKMLQYLAGNCTLTGGRKMAWCGWGAGLLQQCGGRTLVTALKTFGQSSHATSSANLSQILRRWSDKANHLLMLWMRSVHISGPRRLCSACLSWNRGDRCQTSSVSAGSGDEITADCWFLWFCSTERRLRCARKNGLQFGRFCKFERCVWDEHA